MAGKRFRVRDKTVLKLTKEGLVEQNTATGEKKALNPDQQDFDLRADKAVSDITITGKTTNPLSPVLQDKSGKRSQQPITPNSHDINSPERASGSQQNLARHDRTEQPPAKKSRHPAQGQAYQQRFAQETLDTGQSEQTEYLEQPQNSPSLSPAPAPPLRRDADINDLPAYQSEAHEQIHQSLYVSAAQSSESQTEAKAPETGRFTDRAKPAATVNRRQLRMQRRERQQRQRKMRQKGTAYQRRFQQREDGVSAKPAFLTEKPRAREDSKQHESLRINKPSTLQADKPHSNPTQQEKAKAEAISSPEESLPIGEPQRKKVAKESKKERLRNKRRLKFAPDERTPEMKPSSSPVNPMNGETHHDLAASSAAIGAGVGSDHHFGPQARAKASSRGIPSASAFGKRATESAQTSTDSAPKDPKIAKLAGKVEKADAKLDIAIAKLPKKQRLHFDESAGKTAPLASTGATPKGKLLVENVVNREIHSAIDQAGEENLAVEAAHGLERSASRTVHTGKSLRSAFRHVRDTPFRRAVKLEQKAIRANAKLSYQKAVAKSEKMSGNVLSRFFQRQKLKRQYAKAARQAQKAAGKAGLKAARGVAAKLVEGTKALVGAIARHPVVALVAGLILALIFILNSCMSSVTMMGSGLFGMFGGSYSASDHDISGADMLYTEWETDMLLEAQNVENTHPGYDEYRFEIDEVEHDPFELMAYLSAKFGNFTLADVQAELRSLFDEQNTVSYIEEIEILPDGSSWRVLHVIVRSKSFTDVIEGRMNAEEKELFDLYMESKGNRQYMISPFDFNWTNKVISYFGWRVHPITGQKDNHKGIDIAVPAGTTILAGHDGTILSVDNDPNFGTVISIEGADGLTTKYAHCGSVSVTAGQAVKKGDAIGTVGSSGVTDVPKLHLEVIKNGEHLNPIYFAMTNDDGTGGLIPGSPGGPLLSETPGAAMGNGSYAALIAEGEKHLGKKYVFGSKGPNTFDCSSFVSWTLSHSGVRPNTHKTAQGLYDICTPISRENAQPGDLIFFTKTYSTSRNVTHVGIYVGGDQMLHCGKPIQYASFDTAYWRKHFYAFGRLSG